MIRISHTALVFSALLVLILPFHWLLCALFAAVVHELGHILMLMALGGKVHNVEISFGCAVIDGFIPDRNAELLSILAGPVCSLVLLLFWQRTPQIALCGMIQGIFNLMPLYPLDGGRVLRILLRSVIPEKADNIEIVCSAVSLMIALWFIFRASL